MKAFWRLALLQALLCVPLAGWAVNPAQAQPDPIPPPVEQTSADCAHPTYASDVLVCSTSALRALDARMSQLLRAAPIPTAEWVEPQTDWFKRRSLCAFRPDQAACLHGAYAERIAILTALTGKVLSESRTCRRGTVLADARLELDQDGAALVWRAKKLLVAGSWQFDPNIWQPFVAVEVKPDRAIIELPNGKRLRC